MSVDLLIPGWIVVAAAGAGGVIGGFALVLVAIREHSGFDRTRHNEMADIIGQLKRRNKDYAPVERGQFAPKGLRSRIVRVFLRKYRGGRND